MQKTVLAILAACTLASSSMASATAATAENARNYEECYKLADGRGIPRNTYGPKNPRISFVVRCHAGTIK
jgi:hypothetical protein